LAIFDVLNQKFLSKRPGVITGGHFSSFFNGHKIPVQTARFSELFTSARPDGDAAKRRGTELKKE
jgi:hypothetical protein